MPKPDKQAQAREIKLAAMESALKDEIAAWMPQPKTETHWVVQYREGGGQGRHDTPSLLMALEDWLMDENRSPFFIVRPAKEKG